jgi:hypothetical protein
MNLRATGSTKLIMAFCYRDKVLGLGYDYYMRIVSDEDLIR